MFSDKKNANTTGSEPGASQNRINEGTHISGDITSNGFFRIDGFVEGTVTTPSKVVLGKNGVVKGNLSCENADIAGNFTGNLNVSKLLTLRSSANIKGEVLVGKLSVEPGAIFNATCSMQPAQPSQQKPNQSTVYDSSVRPVINTEEQLN
jgi:cytoskeletal protein CcmA (bactofilin family)|tara:strand:- start:384 stop:833 length:450 start_codon:yes stop_codon:yes gene_type:complete